MSELAADVSAMAPELSTWRRELHRHPELGFEEHWTADYVASHLDGLGLEIHRGVGRTGIAAILRAPAAQGAILLRADMDALPVQEVDGRDYASEIPGRMHACGHDGHMAMLLGAARLVAARRERLTHDVLFCFQPAEEGRGGAREMIADGILDLAEVRAVYALHLWSGHEVGSVHVRPGPTMAAQDEIEATFHGYGGHAAAPHVARDPIVAAAYAIAALQTIVSRNVDPLEAAVITVGAIHGGSATNIIPDDCSILGTLRCFNEEVRTLMRRRIPEVLEHSAQACGCRADVEIRHGYPATINDPAAVEVVRRVARPIFGEQQVHEPPPMAASEDFSYFLNERPGAFVFVGAGNQARGITAPHHSPQFDIDEASLPKGAELLAAIALESEHP